MKKAQDFIDLAILEITAEVKEILSKNSMSLPEKDSLILPLIQQKRILKQAKSDLDFMDNKYANLEIGKTCKMGNIRIKNETHEQCK